jgi:hypothetical protein
MTRNLVLLGDSIFDNAVYVDPGQADVTDHLTRKLEPLNWTLDMRAVDGAVVGDVEFQLSRKPVDPPSMIVLSVGGNDALGHMGMAEDTVADKSFADVLIAFNQIREEFRTKFTALLDRILEHEQPLVVCTLFNPKFPEPDIQILAETGLSFFNDVITEEALRKCLPIIDLRDVCSHSAAFANPIEPSELGGDLITSAIIQIMPA